MRIATAYREMRLMESIEDDMKAINAAVHAKAMKSVLARASKIKKKSKAELEAWLEKNKGRAATPNLDKHYPAFAKEVELYKAALAAQPKSESVAEDVSAALEVLDEASGPAPSSMKPDDDVALKKVVLALDMVDDLDEIKVGLRKTNIRLYNFVLGICGELKDNPAMLRQFAKSYLGEE